MSSSIVARAANGRANRKTGKGVQTRNAFIREALRAIAEKGVDGTSVVEIAQRLGVSHGTFYYHFQNMDHLLSEVGHSLVHSLIAKIGSVSRDDAAAQIARGPLTIYQYAYEYKQLQPILLRVVLDVEGIHADIKDGLREDLIKGQCNSRFKIENIDLAAEFCSSLVIAMLRLMGRHENSFQISIQTVVNTLVILGLEIEEAQNIAIEEFALLKDELVNIVYEGLEYTIDE